VERTALAALQQVLRIETVVNGSSFEDRIVIISGFIDVKFVHQATGGNCDNRTLFVEIIDVFFRKRLSADSAA
jgi:hypothetical protein